MSETELLCVILGVQIGPFAFLWFYGAGVMIYRLCTGKPLRASE